MGIVPFLRQILHPPSIDDAETSSPLKKLVCLFRHSILLSNVRGSLVSKFMDLQVFDRLCALYSP